MPSHKSPTRAKRRYLRFALVGDSCDGMLYSSVLGPMFYQVFVPPAKCRYLRFALVGDCVTACCFIYDLLSLFFLPSMAWRPSLHVCLMDNQVLYPCGTWNMEHAIDMSGGTWRHWCEKRTLRRCRVARKDSLRIWRRFLLGPICQLFRSHAHEL